MPSRPVTPYFPATSIFGAEFDRGPAYANWRPQGSRDWLLIYTVAGGGAIGRAAGTFRTRPGDLLLYELGAAQDYGTAPEAGRWRLRWAHFFPRPAWHEWLCWPEIAPGIRLVHLSGAWRRPGEEALGRMLRACRRPTAIQRELALTALEEVILCGHAVQAEKKGIAIDPRIERAIAFLTDRFKEPFRLPALARECGLSLSRFSHLFRLQTGQTPGQFIEKQRLSHAVHLLRRTALTVGEIAAECGFADPFYFTNRFRGHQGMSPSRFRNKARAAGSAKRRR